MENDDIGIVSKTHVLALTSLGKLTALPTAAPVLSYTTTFNNWPEFEPPLM